MFRRIGLIGEAEQEIQIIGIDYPNSGQAAVHYGERPVQGALPASITKAKKRRDLCHWAWDVSVE